MKILLQLFSQTSFSNLLLQIRIKVTIKEYSDLSNFIDKCRVQKHWDLAYVWVKLMTDNAFHFVAAE